MTQLEQENESYINRVDEIAETFRRDKPFYSKQWIDHLLAVSSAENTQEPKICIWGAGHFGMDCYTRFFKVIGLEISCFCDNSAETWGKEVIDSIPCISPAELKAHGTYGVIIAVNGHQDEIYRQCIDMGIPDEALFYAPINFFSWAANYLCSVDHDFCNRMVSGVKEVIGYFGEDIRSKELVIELLSRRLLKDTISCTNDGTQYFIPELPIRPDEAFVDVGAYDGDTLRSFLLNLPHGMLHQTIQYYALECDAENYSALQHNVEQLKCPFQTEIYPFALWDQKEELCFSGDGTSGVIDNNGCRVVQAGRLEDILPQKKITWIKMDIEGAEMRALNGCAAKIQADKPRLSICVYHKPEDLYEIPRYIKSLRSDYRFLLRHHSDEEFETVLYAY